MPAHLPEKQEMIPARCPFTQLELTVRNHPGVMSQICGLFARRGYNVEGILCMPEAHGGLSRIWLLVSDDHRLEQILKQASKLEDVVAARQCGAERAVFARLEEFFRTGRIS